MSEEELGKQKRPIEESLSAFAGLMRAIRDADMEDEDEDEDVVPAMTALP